MEDLDALQEAGLLAGIEDPPVQYRTFCGIWDRLCPHVAISPSQEFFCDTCLKLSQAVDKAKQAERKKSSNATRKVITAAEKAIEVHRGVAAAERKIYLDALLAAETTDVLVFDYAGKEKVCSPRQS